MSGKVCLSCERGNTRRCPFCPELHSNGNDHCSKYCDLLPTCYSIIRKEQSSPSPSPSPKPIINPMVNPIINPIVNPIINPIYSRISLSSPIRIINRPFTSGPIHRITYLSSRYMYSNDIISNINLNSYLKVSNDSCYYENIISSINMNRGPCIMLNNMSHKVFAHEFGNGSSIYLIRM
jgi:hypothetical protein